MLIEIWKAISENSFLLLVLGAGWWLIQHSLVERKKHEETVRDARLALYERILHPFVIVLSAAGGTEDEKIKSLETVTAEIQSVEYRASAFRLTFIGSDDMVKAFNSLWQNAFYEQSESGLSNPLEKLEMFGDFLLAIRKDLGNGSTKLENLEMFEWMINDFRKLRELNS